MIELAVLAIICITLITMPYNWYVKIVRAKNNVQEAFASIDVQLKKRYDLIPNILTIAQKFMDHERSLIEDITNLRVKAANSRNPEEKINIDNEVAAKMNQLFINAENYPQLKSDSTMVQAMQTYAEVEEHISAARRFYNSAVKELNNLCEILPTSLIAGMLYIRKYPYFEVLENEKRPVNVSEYLK